MSSITESTPTNIVKSDRTGRTRYTRQYKQEVLAAFESSSLSAPVFAAQCGIKYPTFAAWIAAGKAQAPKRAGNSPTFLVAQVSPLSEGPSLEVHLPGGAIARAFDLQQVRLIAELLRNLA
jgi:hypothetical protein